MPNIFIRIPKGAFPGDARNELVQRVNAGAASAEKIPPEPRSRMLCWVQIEEIESGFWTCGGIDLNERLLTCFAMVYLPEGVLNAEDRATYVNAIHEAFSLSLPPVEKRQLTTSVILHEVTDGNWGVNGDIWNLHNFAQAAGFAHLQNLVNS
jgi:phenylpyruvate tautomerase PptA (4-oxalocrotonate tautomerase family)